MSQPKSMSGIPRNPRKRRQRPQVKWVYVVQVCDYEACWPVYTFDAQQKAEQYCERYQLNKRNHEQHKSWYKMRVF